MCLSAQCGFNILSADWNGRCFWFWSQHFEEQWPSDVIFFRLVFWCCTCVCMQTSLSWRPALPTWSNMIQHVQVLLTLLFTSSVSSCVMSQNQACLNHAANMKILKLRLVFRTDVPVGAMRIQPEFLWYPQQLVVLVCPERWRSKSQMMMN